LGRVGESGGIEGADAVAPTKAFLVREFGQDVVLREGLAVVAAGEEQIATGVAEALVIVEPGFRGDVGGKVEIVAPRFFGEFREVIRKTALRLAERLDGLDESVQVFSYAGVLTAPPAWKAVGGGEGRLAPPGCEGESPQREEDEGPTFSPEGLETQDEGEQGGGKA